MKSNLYQIIEFWTAEKEILEQEIEDAIKEKDFELAHYLSQSLGRIINKLATLKELDPSNYWKIKDLKKGIVSLENVLKTEKAKRKIFTLEYRLKLFRDRLNGLENKKASAPLDSQEIDDLLVKLSNNEISGFRMYLNQKDNIYIDISTHKNITLELKLTDSLYLKNMNWLDHRFIARLKLVGFNYNSSNNLTLHKDLELVIDFIAIKTIFSRIVYEVYPGMEIIDPLRIELF